MVNASLNQAIIYNLINHIRRGEINYCTQLGFDETELTELCNLSTQEICDLAESKINFAEIKVNHNAFWSLIESVREETRKRNAIDRALQLGASSEILHSRFGWSSAEVSARRRLLGINESMGRKRNATEEEENKIWDLWQKHKQSVSYDVSLTFEGFDLLMYIAEESQVSLTEVSRLVIGWQKNGQ